MKYRKLATTSLVAFVLSLFNSLPLELHAQKIGTIVVPASSIRRPEDVGVRAHTNVILNIHPNSSAPGSTWETPASIACIYQIVPQVAGCPISGTTINPSGGYGAIAIVDAYHYPTAANDLAIFSSQFGLPQANFQVVYASGSQPVQDPTGGWELEEALDIEWSHAMAPNAKIYLVEAASNNWTDLLAAEQIASNLVYAAGGGEVTNSWGGGELSNETSYDSYFTASEVVFFASTGDSAFELEYPAVSPNVVAAGGTTIQRDSSGNFTGEVYWDNSYGGGGGGFSQYESAPQFQTTLSYSHGPQRGVPDISAVADPTTGVAIYDSTAYDGSVYGWLQIGGTSVASPLLAGRTNAAAATPSTNDLLINLYQLYSSAYATNFRDITQGNSNCTAGWDICAGIGSPLGSNWAPTVCTANYNSCVLDAKANLSDCTANASGGAQRGQCLKTYQSDVQICTNGYNQCTGNAANINIREPHSVSATTPFLSEQIAELNILAR